MHMPELPPLNAPVAIVVFVLGVILAIWATERLLEGLVGLARAVSLSTFAVGALLSGFEAENIAVGLAAGAGNAPNVALGTVFGGAMFLVCVALGVAGLLYPLHVNLPRGVLVSFAIAPLLAGLAVLGDRTPRLAGVALLVIFTGLMAYLVIAARRHKFLDPDEVEEALEHPRPWPVALLMTIVGMVVIGIGGDMVATGATAIVRTLGVPAALMGMVVAPAAIELEEIVRQAVPTRAGHPEVSAGNLIGTLFYFVLFNLGLIALFTPVEVDPQVRTLDWPAVVAATLLATAFLARGCIGRVEGAVLLGVYGLYVVAHVIGG
jgi:cation:H+ antiporter